MKKTILAMLMLIAIGILTTGCINETTDTESTADTSTSIENDSSLTSDWKLVFEGYDTDQGWFTLAPYGESDNEKTEKANQTDNSAVLQNTDKRILLGGGYDVSPTDMYEGQDYIRIDMEVTTLPPADQLEEVKFGDKTYYSWDRCTYGACDAPGITSTVYYYQKEDDEVFSFEIHTGSEVEDITWQAILTAVQ